LTSSGRWSRNSFSSRSSGTTPSSCVFRCSTATAIRVSRSGGVDNPRPGTACGAVNSVVDFQNLRRSTTGIDIMNKTLLLTGILAAAAFAPAFAADQPIDVRAESPAAQFDDIRKALATEDYAEITAADRSTVLQLIDRM